MTKMSCDHIITHLLPSDILSSFLSLSLSFDASTSSSLSSFHRRSLSFRGIIFWLEFFNFSLTQSPPQHGSPAVNQPPTKECNSRDHFPFSRILFFLVCTSLLQLRLSLLPCNNFLVRFFQFLTSTDLLTVSRTLCTFCLSC